MILYEVQHLLKILSFLFYTTLVVGSISDKGERMQNGAFFIMPTFSLVDAERPSF